MILLKNIIRVFCVEVVRAFYRRSSSLVVVRAFYRRYNGTKHRFEDQVIEIGLFLKGKLSIGIRLLAETNITEIGSWDKDNVFSGTKYNHADDTTVTYDHGQEMVNSRTRKKRRCLQDSR